MKRAIYYLMTLVLFTAVFASCSSNEDSMMYDQNLLVGKWKSGTLFYRYNAGGTGGTWDTSDDVTESEATKFEWTLDKSNLTHIYLMETRAAGVPKVYTVTKLTESELQYHDDFGKSYSFIKEK